MTTNLHGDLPPRLPGKGCIVIELRLRGELVSYRESIGIDERRVTFPPLPSFPLADLTGRIQAHNVCRH